MSIVKSFFKDSDDSEKNEEENDFLSNNVSHLKQRIQTLSNELNSKSKENFDLLQTNKKLTEDNQILTFKLEKLDAQNNSFKGVIENLQNELANNSTSSNNQTNSNIFNNISWIGFRN